MKIQTIALAILITTTGFAQTPPKVDGGGGARATAQTRPPDNRRPRGTAVALLGWKAGDPLRCLWRNSVLRSRRED